MTFRVELARRAKQDLDDILTWIERRSPQGALTWSLRWHEVIEQLKSSADSCGLAAESMKHDAQIRQLIFKTRRGLPYRVLFQIEGDLVSIITVRGPGQDFIPPQDLSGPKG